MLNKLEVRFSRAPGDATPVGTLAEQKKRVYFEYDEDWLGLGLELSPFHVPLRSGLIEHTDFSFGPLPGLFDDSLPDGWGLLLMDRHFRQEGIAPERISPLDRLGYLGTRTMGALTYHPPSQQSAGDAASLNLHGLAQNARRIYEGRPSVVLPELLRAGGSPGGARPKVLVGYNPSSDTILSGEDDLPAGFEHWIVKFSSVQDAGTSGPVEYAYALMAGRAGLEIPEVRLFETTGGDRFFGVRRFDRGPGNRRFHVHTFGNLIQTDFRVPGCDYEDLLKATSILTRNHKDSLRVFRLMVFNVMTCNRDDHAKNFAFILDDQTGDWSFAPAYDLTFCIGPGGEHTTTIHGEGLKPATDDILKIADKSGILFKEAQAVIDEVRTGIAGWVDIARQTGAPTDLPASWPVI